MKRRRFLQSALGLTAGSLLPANHFIRRPQTPEPIIGQGEFLYAVDLHWGDADPAKYPVNDCHEMAMDKSGRIFMTTNDTRNNILIYNKDGKIKGAWGTEYPGAHGLTLHDENGTEFLYITDYARHEVVKTTLDGKVVRIFDYPADSGKYPSKDKFSPTETAIAPDGDVFIADGYGMDYIAHYSPEGRLKNVFGGKTELNNAHGISLDLRRPGEPGFLVTSRADNQLKRYTMEGVMKESYSFPGAFICRPVIHGENVYFAVLISHLPWDSQSGYILILDKNNRAVSCPAGSAPHYDPVPPGGLQTLYQTIKVFKHPHDVLVDGDGNIYVTQWNSGKVYPARLLKR